MEAGLKKFFKKHIWLLLSLILFILVPTIIFLIVFRNQLNDINTWATLISGIFTYLGTSILSIFVYYNTWKHEEISYIKNFLTGAIDFDILSINCIYKKNTKDVYFTLEPIDKEKLRSYKIVGDQFVLLEDCNMISVKFVITNEIIKIIKPISVYYEENGKIKNCDSFIYQKEISGNDYILHLGIKKQDIPMNYCDKRNYFLVYLVFKIINKFGGAFYYVIDFIYSQTFGVLGSYILKEKEYMERINTYGTPIEHNFYDAQFVKD